MRVYDNTTIYETSDEIGNVTSVTENTTLDIYGDYDFSPDGDAIQTQRIQLDQDTSLLIKYEITFGDLLISTLLFLLISVQLIKFFHKIIFKRKRG